jgi:hypothetical protein
MKFETCATLDTSPNPREALDTMHQAAGYFDLKKGSPKLLS